MSEQEQPLKVIRRHRRAPKSKVPRTSMAVEVTQEEYDLICDAAEAKDMPYSHFIREAAFTVARNALDQ